MMDKLIKEVSELVEAEYGRAAAKFGCANNSDHESYAVLQEELDEALDEVGVVEDAMAYFWGQVKRNSPDQEKIKICDKLEKCALLAACEFIQVAAMAKKAAITVAGRNVIVIPTEMAGDRE